MPTYPDVPESKELLVIRPGLLDRLERRAEELMKLERLRDLAVRLDALGRLAPGALGPRPWEGAALQDLLDEASKVGHKGEKLKAASASQEGGLALPEEAPSLLDLPALATLGLAAIRVGLCLGKAEDFVRTLTALALAVIEREHLFFGGEPDSASKNAKRRTLLRLLGAWLTELEHASSWVVPAERLTLEASGGNEFAHVKLAIEPPEQSGLKKVRELVPSPDRDGALLDSYRTLERSTTAIKAPLDTEFQRPGWLAAELDLPTAAQAKALALRWSTQIKGLSETNPHLAAPFADDAVPASPASAPYYSDLEPTYFLTIRLEPTIPRADEPCVLSWRCSQESAVKLSIGADEEHEHEPALRGEFKLIAPADAGPWTLRLTPLGEAERKVKVEGEVKRVKQWVKWDDFTVQRCVDVVDAPLEDAGPVGAAPPTQEVLLLQASLAGEQSAEEPLIGDNALQALMSGDEPPARIPAWVTPARPLSLEAWSAEDDPQGWGLLKSLTLLALGHPEHASAVWMMVLSEDAVPEPLVQRSPGCAAVVVATSSQAAEAWRMAVELVVAGPHRAWLGLPARQDDGGALRIGPPARRELPAGEREVEATELQLVKVGEGVGDDEQLWPLYSLREAPEGPTWLLGCVPILEPEATLELRRGSELLHVLEALPGDAEVEVEAEAEEEVWQLVDLQVDFEASLPDGPHHLGRDLPLSLVGVPSGEELRLQLRAGDVTASPPQGLDSSHGLVLRVQRGDQGLVLVEWVDSEGESGSGVPLNAEGLSLSLTLVHQGREREVGSAALDLRPSLDVVLVLPPGVDREQAQGALQSAGEASAVAPTFVPQPELALAALDADRILDTLTALAWAHPGLERAVWIALISGHPAFDADSREIQGCALVAAASLSNAKLLWDKILSSAPLERPVPHVCLPASRDEHGALFVGSPFRRDLFPRVKEGETSDWQLVARGGEVSSVPLAVLKPLQDATRLLACLPLSEDLEGLELRRGGRVLKTWSLDAIPEQGQTPLDLNADIPEGWPLIDLPLQFEASLSGFTIEAGETASVSFGGLEAFEGLRVRLLVESEQDGAPVLAESTAIGPNQGLPQLQLRVTRRVEGGFALTCVSPSPEAGETKSMGLPPEGLSLVAELLYKDQPIETVAVGTLRPVQPLLPFYLAEGVTEDGLRIALELVDGLLATLRTPPEGASLEGWGLLEALSVQALAHPEHADAVWLAVLADDALEGSLVQRSPGCAAVVVTTMKHLADAWAQAGVLATEGALIEVLCLPAILEEDGALVVGPAARRTLPADTLPADTRGVEEGVFHLARVGGEETWPLYSLREEPGLPTRLVGCAPMPVGEETLELRRDGERLLDIPSPEGEPKPVHMDQWEAWTLGWPVVLDDVWRSKPPQLPKEPHLLGQDIRLDVPALPVPNRLTLRLRTSGGEHIIERRTSDLDGGGLSLQLRAAAGSVELTSLGQEAAFVLPEEGLELVLDLLHSGLLKPVMSVALGLLEPAVGLVLFSNDEEPLQEVDAAAKPILRTSSASQEAWRDEAASRGEEGLRGEACLSWLAEQALAHPDLQGAIWLVLLSDAAGEELLVRRSAGCAAIGVAPVERASEAWRGALALALSGPPEAHMVLPASLDKAGALLRGQPARRLLPPGPLGLSESAYRLALPSSEVTAPFGVLSQGEGRPTLLLACVPIAEDPSAVRFLRDGEPLLDLQLAELSAGAIDLTNSRRWPLVDLACRGRAALPKRPHRVERDLTIGVYGFPPPHALEHRLLVNGHPLVSIGSDHMGGGVLRVHARRVGADYRLFRGGVPEEGGETEDQPSVLLGPGGLALALEVHHRVLGRSIGTLELGRLQLGVAVVLVHFGTQTPEDAADKLSLATEDSAVLPHITWQLHASMDTPPDARSALDALTLLALENPGHEGDIWLALLPDELDLAPEVEVGLACAYVAVSTHERIGELWTTLLARRSPRALRDHLCLPAGLDSSGALFVGAPVRRRLPALAPAKPASDFTLAADATAVSLHLLRTDPGGLKRFVGVLPLDEDQETVQLRRGQERLREWALAGLSDEQAVVLGQGGGFPDPWTLAALPQGGGVNVSAHELAPGEAVGVLFKGLPPLEGLVFKLELRGEDGDALSSVTGQIAPSADQVEVELRLRRSGGGLVLRWDLAEGEAELPMPAAGVTLRAELFFKEQLEAIEAFELGALRPEMPMVLCHVTAEELLASALRTELGDTGEVSPRVSSRQLAGLPSPWSAEEERGGEALLESLSLQALLHPEHAGAVWMALVPKETLPAPLVRRGQGCAAVVVSSRSQAPQAWREALPLATVGPLERHLCVPARVEADGALLLGAATWRELPPRPRVVGEGTYTLAIPGEEAGAPLSALFLGPRYPTRLLGCIAVPEGRTELELRGVGERPHTLALPQEGAAPIDLEDISDWTLVAPKLRSGAALSASSFSLRSEVLLTLPELLLSELREDLELSLRTTTGEELTRRRASDVKEGGLRLEVRLLEAGLVLAVEGGGSLPLDPGGLSLVVELFYKTLERPVDSVELGELRPCFDLVLFDLVSPNDDGALRRLDAAAGVAPVRVGDELSLSLDGWSPDSDPWALLEALSVQALRHPEHAGAVWMALVPEDEQANPLVWSSPGCAAVVVASPKQAALAWAEALKRLVHTPPERRLCVPARMEGADVLIVGAPVWRELPADARGVEESDYTVVVPGEGVGAPLYTLRGGQERPAWVVGCIAAPMGSGKVELRRGLEVLHTLELPPEGEEPMDLEELSGWTLVEPTEHSGAELSASSFPWRGEAHVRFLNPPACEGLTLRLTDSDGAVLLERALTDSEVPEITLRTQREESGFSLVAEGGVHALPIKPGGVQLVVELYYKTLNAWVKRVELGPLTPTHDLLLIGDAAEELQKLTDASAIAPRRVGEGLASRDGWSVEQDPTGSALLESLSVQALRHPKHAGAVWMAVVPDETPLKRLVERSPACAAVVVTRREEAAQAWREAIELVTARAMETVLCVPAREEAEGVLLLGAPRWRTLPAGACGVEESAFGLTLTGGVKTSAPLCTLRPSPGYPRWLLACIPVSEGAVGVELRRGKEALFDMALPPSGEGAIDLEDISDWSFVAPELRSGARTSHLWVRPNQSFTIDFPDLPKIDGLEVAVRTRGEAPQTLLSRRPVGEAPHRFLFRVSRQTDGSFVVAPEDLSAEGFPMPPLGLELTAEVYHRALQASVESVDLKPLTPYLPVMVVRPAQPNHSTKNTRQVPLVELDDPLAPDPKLIRAVQVRPTFLEDALTLVRPGLLETIPDAEVQDILEALLRLSHDAVGWEGSLFVALLSAVKETVLVDTLAGRLAVCSPNGLPKVLSEHRRRGGPLLKVAKRIYLSGARLGDHGLALRAPRVEQRAGRLELSAGPRPSGQALLAELLDANGEVLASALWSAPAARADTAGGWLEADLRYIDGGEKIRVSMGARVLHEISVIQPEWKHAPWIEESLAGASLAWEVPSGETRHLEVALEILLETPELPDGTRETMWTPVAWPAVRRRELRIEPSWLLSGDRLRVSTRGAPDARCVLDLSELKHPKKALRVVRIEGGQAAAIHVDTGRRPTLVTVMWTEGEGESEADPTEDQIITTRPRVSLRAEDRGADDYPDAVSLGEVLFDTLMLPRGDGRPLVLICPTIIDQRHGTEPEWSLSHPKDLIADLQDLWDRVAQRETPILTLPWVDDALAALTELPKDWASPAVDALVAAMTRRALLTPGLERALWLVVLPGEQEGYRLARADAAWRVAVCTPNGLDRLVDALSEEADFHTVQPQTSCLRLLAELDAEGMPRILDLRKESRVAYPQSLAAGELEALGLGEDELVLWRRPLGSAAGPRDLSVLLPDREGLEVIELRRKETTLRRMHWVETPSGASVTVSALSDQLDDTKTLVTEVTWRMEASRRIPDNVSVELRIDVENHEETNKVAWTHLTNLPRTRRIGAVPLHRAGPASHLRLVARLGWTPLYSNSVQTRREDTERTGGALAIRRLGKSKLVLLKAGEVVTRPYWEQGESIESVTLEDWLPGAVKASDGDAADQRLGEDDGGWNPVTRQLPVVLLSARFEASSTIPLSPEDFFGKIERLVRTRGISAAPLTEPPLGVKSLKELRFQPSGPNDPTVDELLEQIALLALRSRGGERKLWLCLVPGRGRWNRTSLAPGAGMLAVCPDGGILDVLQAFDDHQSAALPGLEERVMRVVVSVDQQGRPTISELRVEKRLLTHRRDTDAEVVAILRGQRGEELSRVPLESWRRSPPLTLCGLVPYSDAARWLVIGYQGYAVAEVRRAYGDIPEPTFAVVDATDWNVTAKHVQGQPLQARLELERDDVRFPLAPDHPLVGGQAQLSLKDCLLEAGDEVHLVLSDGWSAVERPLRSVIQPGPPEEGSEP